MLPETGGTEFGKDLDQAVAEVDVAAATGSIADLETEGDLVGKSDRQAAGYALFAELLQMNQVSSSSPFRFGQEDFDAVFVTTLPVEAGQEVFDHFLEEFTVAQERFERSPRLHGSTTAFSNRSSTMMRKLRAAVSRSIIICFRRLSASRLAFSTDPFRFFFTLPQSFFQLQHGPVSGYSPPRPSLARGPFPSVRP